MHLLRTPGLDLTVFPEDTPILHTKDEMIEAAAAGAESFVRSVSLDIPATLSLKGALAVVNEQVEVINELTSTATVEYEWGLVPGTPQNTCLQTFGRSGEHLVPRGYVLVAKVDVVQGKTLSAWDANHGEPYVRKLKDDLSDYERTYRGRYYLADIRVGQFIRPFDNESTGDHPRPVLVDIEPRIAKQRFMTRHFGRTAPPPADGMLWI